MFDGFDIIVCERPAIQTPYGGHAPEIIWCSTLPESVLRIVTFDFQGGNQSSLTFLVTYVQAIGSKFLDSCGVLVDRLLFVSGYTGHTAPTRRTGPDIVLVKNGHLNFGKPVFIVNGISSALKRNAPFERELSDDRCHHRQDPRSTSGYNLKGA